MSEQAKDRDVALMRAHLSAVRVRNFTEEGRPAAEIAGHARAASARYAELAAMLDGPEPRVLYLVSPVPL